RISFLWKAIVIFCRRSHRHCRQYFAVPRYRRPGAGNHLLFHFHYTFLFFTWRFYTGCSTMLLYALTIWIFKTVWIATAVTVGALILFMLIGKKRLSESSIMALVVVSGFLLLDQVPVLAKIIPGPI